MSQVISHEAIERATGKSWPTWLAYFKAIDAANLPHKEIARQVYESGVPGWWSQMLTVAYEQYIGRRVPGQDCDGEYAVSVNKTVPGKLDDAFNAWIRLMSKRHDFSDIAIGRNPETSQTEKWRYWRCGLVDGTRINVNFNQKAEGKVSLSVQHEKLESSEQVEHWRSYWKDIVARF